MKKKHTYTPKKRLTYKEIISGNIFNREDIRANYKFLLLIFSFILISISFGHCGNQKVSQINKLKEEMEEYKSRNAYIQSKLIKVKMESQLSKEMLQDSLLPLESHPHKLLIKTEQSNGKK